MDNINQSKTTLHTFKSAPFQPLETVNLVVHVEPYNYLEVFYIIDSNPAQHHLGPKLASQVRTIPSSYNQLLLYPTLSGIKEMKGDVVIVPSSALENLNMIQK